MKAKTYGIKLFFTIVDQDNEVLDLTGGIVKLYVKMGTTVTEYDLTVENAEQGIATYVTQEGDFDTTGSAKMEVEVEFPDANQMFASENKIKETVQKRIKIT